MQQKAIFSKSVLALVLSWVFAVQIQAQVPRFQKYTVGTKGTTVYFPGAMSESDFGTSYSSDSSRVITGEKLAVDSLNYAMILVELTEPLTEEDMEEVLTNYMDYLKEQFGVTGAAGYGKGHTSEKNPGAKGVIDFWEDAEENKYDVSGWVNSNFIAVMLVYGQKETNYNISKMFRDGIEFGK